MSRQWGEASEAEDAAAAGEILLEQADDYAARAGCWRDMAQNPQGTVAVRAKCVEVASALDALGDRLRELAALGFAEGGGRPLGSTSVGST